jgi:hypothetical protein
MFRVPVLGLAQLSCPRPPDVDRASRIDRPIASANPANANGDRVAVALTADGVRRARRHYKPVRVDAILGGKRRGLR